MSRSDSKDSHPVKLTGGAFIAERIILKQMIHIHDKVVSEDATYVLVVHVHYAYDHCVSYVTHYVL